MEKDTEMYNGRVNQRWAMATASSSRADEEKISIRPIEE
jgi:hypothetical protein